MAMSKKQRQKLTMMKRHRRIWEKNQTRLLKSPLHRSDAYIVLDAKLSQVHLLVDPTFCGPQQIRHF
jgi:hypothetical protein